MAKTLMVITVFLFVGAISEFVQPDPVTYHVPGQPVTINDVLATMTTSYLVKHAPGERQFLYVVLSALPIGLAYLWGAFDRKQAHRPKIARFFGGALFVLGSVSAGMLPAFLIISPTKTGASWSSIMSTFAFAAVFLAASWPLCFGLSQSSMPNQLSHSAPGRIS